MKLCFDLDGTLCTNTYGKYKKAKPYKDMISMLNKYYDMGCTIIIQTARGMGGGKKSLFHHERVRLAEEKWYLLTREQLCEWGVRYHHLRLGKIEADVYIDDKAFAVKDDGSCSGFLNRFLEQKIK